MRVLCGPGTVLVDEHGFTLRIHCAGDAHCLRVVALEDDMIRVSLLRKCKRVVERTWMVSPGAPDVPDEGFAKDSFQGFAGPAVAIDTVPDGTLSLSTKRMRCTVNTCAHAPLALQFDWWSDEAGAWLPLLHDRRTGAYYLSRRGDGLAHFTRRQRGDRIFGCGEVSGELDRVGRRFVMSATDAMGYDAQSSDPLYKFWPSYVAKPAGESSAAFGVLYDSMAKCTLDFGCEMDNYHGLFHTYSAEQGDLDYIVVLGPSVLQATRRLSWLTGQSIMPPRWSLGYSGSTMTYTDAPDAQIQLLSFLTLCREHRVSGRVRVMVSPPATPLLPHPLPRAPGSTGAPAAPPAALVVTTDD